MSPPYLWYSAWIFFGIIGIRTSHGWVEWDLLSHWCRAVSQWESATWITWISKDFCWGSLSKSKFSVQKNTCLLGTNVPVSNLWHTPKWPSNRCLALLRLTTRKPPFSGHNVPVANCLVVSNIFYFPRYMGCHPSHWLSYFSRWLLHHQPAKIQLHFGNFSPTDALSFGTRVDSLGFLTHKCQGCIG